jgi:23S rRNA (uridine2552-2'-O)-methyltransferase
VTQFKAVQPVAKNKFNQNWLHDHINDPYVKLAQKHQYRARAAFKLIEIDRDEKLIRRGMTVVDLGSAPGSWCQVLRERMANGLGGIDGHILALDMLPMEQVADVEFIQGDFREQEVLAQLEASLGTICGGVPKVDLVVSDMAPNLSGVPSVDGARMEGLVELAIEFCQSYLKPDGALLVKCFHGSSYSNIVNLFKQNFVKVVVKKPPASRAKSAETYLVGKVRKVARS